MRGNLCHLRRSKHPPALIGALRVGLGGPWHVNICNLPIHSQSSHRHDNRILTYIVSALTPQFVGGACWHAWEELSPLIEKSARQCTRYSAHQSPLAVSAVEREGKAHEDS